MFLDMLRSCSSYILFFGYWAVLAVPTLLLLCLPFSYSWVKILYAYLSKVTCKFVLFCTFLPVTYQGFDQLPDTPSIYIANHQSALDIMLIGSVLGARPCVWLAKSELFEYPLLGQLLSKIGVPVYFDKQKEGKLHHSAVQVASEKLAQGFNVIIFPEGGRYNDGSIHEFRSGFAALAKISGAPVVPLFISGTGQALGIGQRILRKAPLIITVGQKTLYNTNESVLSFKERCYQWFVELNFRRQYLLEHFGIRICKTEYFNDKNGEIKNGETV